MPNTAGTAELIAALSGGGRIENAAYGREANRILDAQNARAMLDKRVVDAAMAARTNESQRGLPSAFSSAIRSMEPNQSTFGKDQIAALGPILLQGGYTASDFDKMMQIMSRAAMDRAAGEAGLTPMNQASQTFNMGAVPGIEEIGDLIVRGNLTANPQVDTVLTELNAGANASAGAPGVREQEIQDLMRMINPDTNRPFTRPEAVRKKEWEDVRVDNQGNVIAVDSFNRAADSVLLGGDQPSPPIPAPPPGGTMMELASVGTGLMAAGSDIFARTVSLFGFNPNFAASQAMGQMKSMALQIINSQRQNPRFSEGERTDLLKRFNVEPGMFRSEGYAISQLQALKQVLTTVAAQNDADAADPRLTTKERGAARNHAREARNSIALIGEIPGQTTEGASFLQDLDLDNMTPEEIEEAHNRWKQR